MNGGNIRRQIILLICFMSTVKVHSIPSTNNDESFEKNPHSDIYNSTTNIPTTSDQLSDSMNNSQIIHIDRYGRKLIYSTTNSINFFNISSNETTVIKMGLHSKLLAAYRDTVYYTTNLDNSKTIFMINSSNETVGIIKSNSSITSIAIDYITDNLYFTSNQSLSVCSKGGKNCMQLKCCNISRITLAPKFGLMFYIKKFNKSNETFTPIMKSNTDGSNEQLFINNTSISDENLLMAVDELSERLYWLKGNHVFSVHLRKNDSNAHNSTEVNSDHILKSFAVVDRILLFSAENDTKIYQAKNASFGEILDTNIDGKNNSDVRNSTVENLVAYNSIRQLALKAGNPCANATCSSLCLLSASSNTSKNHTLLSYKCANIEDPVSRSNDTRQTDAVSKQTDPSSHLVTPAENHSTGSPVYVAFGTVLSALVLITVVLGIGYFIYRRYDKMNPHSVWYVIRPKNFQRLHEDNEEVHLL